MNNLNSRHQPVKDVLLWAVIRFLLRRSVLTPSRFALLSDSVRDKCSKLHMDKDTENEVLNSFGAYFYE